MSGFVYGDWDSVIARLGGWQKNLERALKVALKQEAHFARTQIIQGIDSGAPGGQTFTPRSALTLALMSAQGQANKTKVLIRNADLRNSITVVEKGWQVFVGVLKQARSRAGKNLHNIAAVHEYGAGPFAVRWTPKSRRWFWAMLRKAGLVSGRRMSGGGASGMRLVRIPARPFMRPIFRQHWSDREAARNRFFERVLKLLRGYSGH